METVASAYVGYNLRGTGSIGNSLPATWHLARPNIGTVDFGYSLDAQNRDGNVVPSGVGVGQTIFVLVA